MRGKAEVPPAKFSAMRITPAYAGKRQIHRSAERPLKDHPRLCGEKWDSIIDWFDGLGSPPPMRGKA